MDGDYIYRYRLEPIYGLAGEKQENIEADKSAIEKHQPGRHIGGDRQAGSFET